MNNFVFGTQSAANLATCHPVLRETAEGALALTPVDFAIVWGWRDRQTQNNFHRMGTSKKLWPDSAHNNLDDMGEPCSLALDFAPYINGSIPWSDRPAFALVAGVFFAAFALMLEREAWVRHWRLRWGADWNQDGRTIDETFLDLGHLEIYSILPGA